MCEVKSDNIINKKEHREDLLLMDKEGLIIVPIRSSVEEYVGNIALTIYCASNNMMDRLNKCNEDIDNNITKITIE
ncbi:hypothetical protein [Methanothermococcus okinawensis]|uniref:Uncharacterized protein n=1 Tax=Methanothermococcus okinawensis (strain DSM 14208 / JCM 11175 / IH1) TaxID=647113 RepID=F8ALI0_METOI|nr:hypothetical protein [Methanothermococcus okinawensis]AEH06999.1 hypothetical protein Metok_1029 [Methanothermococcus okinawensis IH1]